MPERIPTAPVVTPPSLAMVFVQMTFIDKRLTLQHTPWNLRSWSLDSLIPANSYKEVLIYLCLSRWILFMYHSIIWMFVLQTCRMHVHICQRIHIWRYWHLIHYHCSVFLECRPWQALGEDVWWLVRTCNLEQLDFQCHSCGELPDAIYPGVNVSRSIVHAGVLAQEHACVIVLAIAVAPLNLLVSHHVHHAPQIYTVESTQWHTVKFVLGAAYSCHWLSLGRPWYHCSVQ